MVTVIYSGAVSPRKRECDGARKLTHSLSEAANAPVPMDTAPADLPRDPVASGQVTPEVRAALLSAVGHSGGVVDLDCLVAAIPDHPQPLCAILAMVDAGVLALDTTAPFGGDLRLWRTAL